jgi:hypothetical protein
MGLLVDDLLRSYRDGFAVRDAHRLEDFRMRTILLLWTGDYQGQAKIANMKHSGLQACHWCWHPFHKRLVSTGSCMGDNNRRYLDAESPLRLHPDYGTDHPDPAQNVPPRNRTHEETCAFADELAEDEITQNKTYCKDKQHMSGINGFCVLVLLPLFNIIMDICLDWMHVVKNIWEEHLIKLFKGGGAPCRPTTPSFNDKRGAPLQGTEKTTAEAKHAECIRLYREIKHVRATHHPYP